MVRVRLDLAYDGTGYAGWAAQAHAASVQGEIEKVLGVLVRGPAPRLTVAGRTDAGVHARGQVAHVDLPEPVATDRLLLRRLNGLLPRDVRVRRVSAAPPGFDARFSAIWRRYVYRVVDDPALVDPLRRHDVLAWNRPLDLVALRAACPPMLGVHDFAAFCKKRPDATTVRGLLALDWERGADGVLAMTITADAFCHSMVRSVVGSMLAVGEGKQPPSWPASLLTLGRRAVDVLVVPPHGLVLEEVGYPPDAELATRQETTRALRPAHDVQTRPAEVAS